MKAIADLALDQIMILILGTPDQIDPDFQASVVAELPERFVGLTALEKQALAEAARRRLLRISSMFPDAGSVSVDSEISEVDILESVVSGQLFEAT